MNRSRISIAAVLAGVAVLMGIAFLLTFSIAVSSAQETKAKDGKAIYAKYECAGCHAIAAVGIKKQVGGAEPGDDEAPDLSGVGAKRTADWISKWLLKKETIDGKKHEKKFKGNAEELDTLAKWLETLKTGAKGGKK